MSSPFSIDAKASLRRRMRERRAELPEAERKAGAEGLRDRFLVEVDCAPGSVVSGYWPVEAEMDVRPLLLALVQRGHEIALPVVVGRGRPLLFRRWRENDALDEATFGLLQPQDSAPEVEPDLLLTPLLAFDRRGDRLGYGAGYYDLTLSALRRRRPVMAVGVAFAAQEVEDVPKDPWDEPLDWIVTEQSAIKIDKA